MMPNNFLMLFVTSQAVMALVCGVHVEKWHKFGSSQRIFIETEPKYNWHKAWHECAVRNMTLINIENSDKSNALKKLLDEVVEKSENIWIGGNDIGDEGNFVWHSTGKHLEFTNWKIGNPDNSGGDEDCVHLVGNNVNYEWNDIKCSQKMGFICESNQMLAMEREKWDLRKEVIDRLFEL